MTRILRAVWIVLTQIHRHKRAVGVLCGFFFLVSTSAFGAARILHEFTGEPDDGGEPYDSLILDGSTLYGMTNIGGNENKGVIFKINMDGTGYAILHEFAGGGSDGALPQGSLILSGTTLYGMTTRGGDHDKGVIFKVQTDGSGFSLIHEFAGGTYDGDYPTGSLTRDGTTLYGVTWVGGDSNCGVVFKILTKGTDFSLLHEFVGGVDGGRYATGDLVLDGTTLYGMTTRAGDDDKGVIYKLETDGTDFSLLHEFSGGADDGAFPYGSLVLDGSTLYGMTSDGGDSEYGVIFGISTKGIGFSLLHEFSGSDGCGPKSDLLLDDGRLYGTTRFGGMDGNGVVFKLRIKGREYSLLHEFADGGDDGTDPSGPLIRSGAVLYGMTWLGGHSDYGVIYSLPLVRTDPAIYLPLLLEDG